MGHFGTLGWEEVLLAAGSRSTYQSSAYTPFGEMMYPSHPMLHNPPLDLAWDWARPSLYAPASHLWWGGWIASNGGNAATCTVKNLNSVNWV